MVVVGFVPQSPKIRQRMATMVFRLERRRLCLLIIIPIVEGYPHEEVEDFVVEGLVQGLIEVEEYHEEGSEVEVEGLLLLLKLCRECALDWLFVCFVVLSEWRDFFSLVTRYSG